MRVVDLISEQRDKHISSFARPHLDDDEEVLHWVRARHPSERRQGYVYITSRKLLVVWTGGGENGPRAVAWEDIRSWGVDRGAGAGPLLGVESDSRSLFVHMPVSSSGAARRVTRFLRRLAHLAPSPRHSMLKGHPGRFEASSEVEISVAKLSASALTRRVIATVVGLLLVGGGVIITPIPGPWSLPIVLAGLALLASEYDWAEDTLAWVREKSRRAKERFRARRAARRR